MYVCDTTSYNNWVFGEDNHAYDCKESARVAQAYVWLELNNPLLTLQMVEVVLDSPVLTGSDGNECVFSLRRRATARLYDCEAMCILGKATDSLSYLDKVNDIWTLRFLTAVIERLAQELSMGMCSANNNNDRYISRLNEAMIALYISISGVAASIGRFDVAKNYAVQASNFINNNSSTENKRVPIIVVKTLIYCLIGEADNKD